MKMNKMGQFPILMVSFINCCCCCSAAQLCLTHWERLKLGKIEGRRKSGQQRMRWLDDIINSMDRSLSMKEETEQALS